MKKIIPALLTNRADHFKNRVEEYTKIFNRIEIDICSFPFTRENTLGVEAILPILLETEFDGVWDFHIMERDPIPSIELLKNSNLRFKRINIYIHQESDNFSYIAESVEFPELWEKFAAIKFESDLLSVEVYNKFFGVLFLSHEIGVQKAKFNKKTLKKVKSLREMGFSKEIKLDGGINLTTAPQITKNDDINSVSVGSYLQNSKDVKDDLEKLEKILN